MQVFGQFYDISYFIALFYFINVFIFCKNVLFHLLAFSELELMFVYCVNVVKNRLTVKWTRIMYWIASLLINVNKSAGPDGILQKKIEKAVLIRSLNHWQCCLANYCTECLYQTKWRNENGKYMTQRNFFFTLRRMNSENYMQFINLATKFLPNSWQNLISINYLSWKLKNC